MAFLNRSLPGGLISKRFVPSVLNWVTSRDCGANTLVASKLRQVGHLVAQGIPFLHIRQDEASLQFCLLQLEGNRSQPLLWIDLVSSRPSNRHRVEDLLASKLTPGGHKANHLTKQPHLAISAVLHWIAPNVNFDLSY